MKSGWLRRFAYLVFLIVWLAVMAFPFLAIGLASQGELRLGDQTGRHLRLFLIQETETEGVGVEWTRPYADNQSCLQTIITYLLWHGDSQNTTYCQCPAESPENPAECQP